MRSHKIALYATWAATVAVFIAAYVMNSAGRVSDEAMIPFCAAVVMLNVFVFPTIRNIIRRNAGLPTASTIPTRLVRAAAWLSLGSVRATLGVAKVLYFAVAIAALLIPLLGPMVAGSMFLAYFLARAIFRGFFPK